MWKASGSEVEDSNAPWIEYRDHTMLVLWPSFYSLWA